MELKQEIKSIIELNKEELRVMIKEYSILYLKLLCRENTEELRKIIIDSIKNYRKEIKRENYYMNFLHKNVISIQNIEELNDILDSLDYLNETTFQYYDRVLESCEEALLTGDFHKKIILPKDFKPLTERADYQDRIVGLLLTVKDLDQYYQQEDAYLYLKKNSKVIKCPVKEGIPFYGCYPIEENNILQGIRICVPEIVDLKTMLVNIHEYKHGISLMPYLGKEIPTKDYEKIAKYEEEQFKEKYLRKKIV